MDVVPSTISFSLLQRSMSDTVTSSKLHRRRKVRRLAGITKKSNVECQTSRSALLRRHYKRHLVGTMLIALVIIMGSTLVYRRNEWRKFWHNYNSQYHAIINGKPNFCAQTLDANHIFMKIRASEILHQEEALLRLDMVLRNNESNLTPIAIVGAPGVGKSLWARAFAAAFPWPGNVRTYAWNTFVSDPNEKYAVIDLYAAQLSDCGRNLLIFENLTPADIDVVKRINCILRESIAKSRIGPDVPSKSVIVIYIFNMNTYEDEDLYQQQHAALQDIDETTITVNFRRFGVGELNDCILREAAMENIILTTEDVEDIAASIEPSRSGCKNVHAKVMVYGKLEA